MTMWRARSAVLGATLRGKAPVRAVRRNLNNITCARVLSAARFRLRGRCGAKHSMPHPRTRTHDAQGWRGEGGGA